MIFHSRGSVVTLRFTGQIRSPSASSIYETFPFMEHRTQYGTNSNSEAVLNLRDVSGRPTIVANLMNSVSAIAFTL